MATTRKKVTDMLDAKGYRYDLKDDTDNVTGMRMKNYRDADGEDGLLLVLSMDENGEDFRLFAPDAF